jgi:hypothetical protein
MCEVILAPIGWPGNLHKVSCPSLNKSVMAG